MTKDKDGWHYAGDTQLSHQDCREYFADKGATKLDTRGMSADEIEHAADRLEAEADRAGDGSAEELPNLM